MKKRKEKPMQVYVLQISTERDDVDEPFNCFGVFETEEAAEKEAKHLIEFWDEDYKINPEDPTEYGLIYDDGEFDRVGEISISKMEVQK